MRKPLGILILVIGILIIGLCLYDILALHVDVHEKSKFYNGLVIGLLLSIVGIIMINSGKKMKKEQADLKKILSTNAITPSKQAGSNTAKLDQLEKLGNLKEKGLVTEEEFQQQKKKLLE